MQRQKFFLASAGTATALLLGAGAGMTAASAEPSQLTSDVDVWRVRGRLDGMLAQLNGLEADYHGKRGAAISAIQAAKTNLDNAVKIRGVDDAISNEVINVTIEECTEMIGRLTADRGDYNGQKQAAVDQLNIAKAALLDALRHH